MSTPTTFGSFISFKRKENSLSQKELATLIKREDGDPISPQYLNDIEHDRRSPTSDLMVKQFAQILGLPPDYLYYLAGKFPTDVVTTNASPEKVQKAMLAFRQSIK